MARSLGCCSVPLLSAAVLLSCWCGLSGASRPAPTSDVVGGSGNASFIPAWCAGTEYPALSGGSSSMCQGWSMDHPVHPLDPPLPALCNATLSPYAAAVGASPARLACAALNVTADGARDARAAMKGMAADTGHRLAPVAAEAAGDCVSMLGDAVDMLRRSVEAMEEAAAEEGRAAQQQRARRMARFRVDSVRTWASAALTDGDMCLEGFRGEAAGGGGVREQVRGHVAGLLHLGANALCIVNAMASQTPPP